MKIKLGVTDINGFYEEYDCDYYRSWAQEGTIKLYKDTSRTETRIKGMLWWAKIVEHTIKETSFIGFVSQVVKAIEVEV